jgi:hypothetical protein
MDTKAKFSEFSYIRRVGELGAEPKLYTIFMNLNTYVNTLLSTSTDCQIDY